jgi:hypothetical protein
VYWLNFLVPFGYICLYESVFGGSEGLRLAHTALVGALTSGALLLTTQIVRRLPPARRTIGQRFAAGVLAALTTSLAFIYLTTFVSSVSWGDNVNYRILWSHLGNSSLVLSGSPLGGPLVIALIGGVLVLFALLGIVLYRSYRALMRAMAPIDWHPAMLRGGAPRWWTQRGPVAASVASAALLAYQVDAAPYQFFREPVTDFFGWPKASALIEMDPERHAAALEDQRVRSQYPAAQDFEARNVILIVVDALRADHMAIHGYRRDTTPHLSAIQSRGKLHKVDMGLSTCSESYCGIASILASRPFHQVSSRSLKLHEILQKVGYRINFVLAGEHRDWPYLDEFYGSNVDFYYDFQTAGKRFPTDDMLLLDGISEIPEYSGTPNFFYFFAMSAHQLGARYPEFRTFEPSDIGETGALFNEIAGTMRTESGEVQAIDENIATPETLTNYYDNGVVQVDAFIDHILDGLFAKGYLQNSLVVITGDHGDGLGEHGHFGHSRYLHQEDIHVPIVFLDGDPSSYRNSEFATHIDIAPTIVDRLGLAIPESWAGDSLLDPARERITTHQTRRGQNICRAAVSRDAEGDVTKLIRCGQQADSEDEFYELGPDPRERVNLATAPSAQDRIAPLRRSLSRFSGLTVSRCNRGECTD